MVNQYDKDISMRAVERDCRECANLKGTCYRRYCVLTPDKNIFSPFRLCRTFKKAEKKNIG